MLTFLINGERLGFAPGAIKKTTSLVHLLERTLLAKAPSSFGIVGPRRSKHHRPPVIGQDGTVVGIRAIDSYPQIFGVMIAGFRIVFTGHTHLADESVYFFPVGNGATA